MQNLRFHLQRQSKRALRRFVATTSWKFSPSLRSNSNLPPYLSLCTYSSHALAPGSVQHREHRCPRHTQSASLAQSASDVRTVAFACLCLLIRLNCVTMSLAVIKPGGWRPPAPSGPQPWLPGPVATRAAPAQAPPAPGNPLARGSVSAAACCPQSGPMARIGLATPWACPVYFPLIPPVCSNRQSLSPPCEGEGVAGLPRGVAEGSSRPRQHCHRQQTPNRPWGPAAPWPSARGMRGPPLRGTAVKPGCSLSVPAQMNLPGSSLA